ncbi:sulfite exporter TauE/SafE family protein [Chondrinema litorale]|uniref:sulfite exporter TauE/SafE family protein n=1 Tax=Chondrinema litorale TaxID=2994555 RepID=UPI002543DC23|nr:sulfite exporter TauE/SafE family protein [Chondrinema litorale]UZR98975.1 sulfite exporter TauE/SafE family protein [Chondrinema litorale]
MIIILILIGTILSFWISALCGGGASLILIPILSLSLSSAQVPAALTIGTFTSSISRLMVFRKNIHWQIVGYFVPAAIPTVWLGVWALKYVNPIYLQFFIAIFLLINIRQLFLPKQEINKNEKRHPKYILILIGGLAGFISGVTGAVGLLFNKFYLKYGLSKEGIVATRAANEIILHLIKIILYFSMGLFTFQAFQIGSIVAAGAIISSISVKYILPFLSENVFKKVGYLAMVLSGVILLSTTSNKIIAKDHPQIHFKPFSNSVETQLVWNSSEVSFEFEYNKGLQMEQVIKYEEIPKRLQADINPLINQSDKVYYERVTSIGETFYEVHVMKDNKQQKYNFY